MDQNLIELPREMDKSTIIFREFNSLPIIDRKKKSVIYRRLEQQYQPT